MVIPPRPRAGRHGWGIGGTRGTRSHHALRPDRSPINNAGFGYIGLNEACTLADLQHQFDTNFFGVARMNRAVLPHMRRQGRSLVIYMSSGGGRTVSPYLGAYSASKFALEAFAESYRYQLYSLGIDTVILQPGAHATPVASNSLSPSEADRGAGCGSVAAQIEQAVANFRAFFANAAPSPQSVVDAVSAVLAMPPGTRPLRIPIATSGIEEINHVCAEMQMADGRAVAPHCTATTSP